MQLALADLVVWAERVAWPLGRIGGLMLTAPVLGGRNVPARIRAAFALLLALLLAPTLPLQSALPSALAPAGLATMAQQVLIGAAIGFALRLVLEAVAFGGHLVALTMGLSYGEVVDPQSGTSEPMLSQFYLLLATLLFLAMDGHLALIALLGDSFRTLPVGVAFGADALHALVAFGARLFEGALAVALPAVAAMLVVNMGFGVMSRAAPSLNLFAVGFPVTLSLGFVVVWLSLGGLQAAVASLTDAAFELLRALVAARP
ncbi:flagellar biosynthetic protein fliR [Mizugakiibacter sediminis]|uniref:Flagellar biosynthetic protein FliR n=1 Tax=Mizugakiibacter sediminis TaxID=1475481 RepID=A0A0K8QQM8_9GAMM|nr:flagellar biosynthetic protein FliR [Mizugakiibacter sediminis]GAP66682.1 flagellar biosynthetic protein fliR [Mizugakiibacter sediminis]